MGGEPRRLWAFRTVIANGGDPFQRGGSASIHGSQRVKSTPSAVQFNIKVTFTGVLPSTFIDFRRWSADGRRYQISVMTDHSRRLRWLSLIMTASFGLSFTSVTLPEVQISSRRGVTELWRFLGVSRRQLTMGSPICREHTWLSPQFCFRAGLTESLQN